MCTIIISILLYDLDSNNRPAEEDQGTGNEMLRAHFHISHKDHITNAIVCYKIQAAIGPYEEIFVTVKKGNYDGSDMWSDKVSSVKRSYKARYEGKEKEEGKRKDGKITSESGLA